MQILLVNSADIGGGAEGSARRLLHALRQRGHETWLAVGKKRSALDNVLKIPNEEYRSRWAKLIYKKLLKPQKNRLTSKTITLLRIAAEPRRWIERQLGVEDFHYPASHRLLELLPTSPDIVHIFNLHGGYFDLHILPWLSKQVPVILNPRDEWPLTGHCAHSMECARWRGGCGNCPNLTIYPQVKQDATAYNWKRKKRIFSQSHLYVATPSEWLMGEVEESILSRSIVKSRVIPTGIDLSIFAPGDKTEIRANLGLPLNAKVLLFAAHSIQPWKDDKTAQTAVEMVIQTLVDQKIILVALGRDGSTIQKGSSEIRFVPFQHDRNVVADYYRAADVFLHAARADTFPNTVMESMGCGTPVIATNVGGIPEQVKGFGHFAPNGYDVDEATGILVSLGNAKEMADAITHLLTDETIRAKLGKNAAQDCHQRLGFEQQVSHFIDWYQEVIYDWSATFSCKHE
jgi:glycosyltransferase involved in cell wall biosynthesis